MLSNHISGPRGRKDLIPPPAHPILLSFFHQGTSAQRAYARSISLKALDLPSIHGQSTTSPNPEPAPHGNYTQFIIYLTDSDLSKRLMEAALFQFQFPSTRVQFTSSLSATAGVSFRLQRLYWSCFCFATVTRPKGLVASLVLSK